MFDEQNTLKIEHPYYKLKYLFGLLGANSLFVQVVLFRELFVAFSGNELSWGIFFATWLLSGAAGSYLYTRLRLDTAHKNRIILSLFIFNSLLLFAEIIIIRIIKTKLGYQPYETISIEQIFLITSALIFMPSFIFGILFSMVIDFTSGVLKEERDKIAGMVYSFEALGSFIAGIIFNFSLITFFTSIEISVFIFILNMIYGYFLLNKEFVTSKNPFYIVPKKIMFRLAGLFIVTFLSLFLMSKYSVISRITDYSHRTQWQGFNFVKQVESKHGKITVIEKNNQYNFYQNNNLSFILPDTQGAEQRIHMTMTIHASPRKVLLLGGTSEDIKELFKYPLERIVYVELDPLLVQTAIEFTHHDDSLYFRDKLIKTVFEDARKYIKTGDEKFDVIILNSQEPNTVYSNRYFTKEFYDEVKKRLNRGGLFSFSVSSSPNYVSGSMYFMQASIYQTLASSFRNVRLISSGSLRFIASNETELSRLDDIALFERFIKRGLANEYFNEYLFFDLITEKKNKRRESLLKEEEADIINTDFYPKTYLLNILLLGEESGSVFIKAFHWLFLKENRNIIAYLFVIIASFVLAYYIIRFNDKPYLDLYMITFTSGIASISIEILLLFIYQILFGYVYYKIGLLIAIFMLGLFFGSYIGNNYISRISQVKFKTLLIVAEIIFLIYLALTYNFDSYPVLLKNDIIIFISLFLVSFLTGIEYPIANLILMHDARMTHDRSQNLKIGGRLYASELLGACVGSLFLTFFLIPYFGVHNAFAFLIMVKAFSIVLVSARTLLKHTKNRRSIA